MQDLAEGAATLGHDVDVVAYESGRTTRRQATTLTGDPGLFPRRGRSPGDRSRLPGGRPARAPMSFIFIIPTRWRILPRSPGSSGLHWSSPSMPTATTGDSAGCWPGLRWAGHGDRGSQPGPRRALPPSWWDIESKVEVIPFGVDIERWITVPTPVAGGPPKAIFIGRLVRYKGVDILLRALERVPDLRLDIVGIGPGKLAAQDPGPRPRDHRPDPLVRGVS